MKKGDRQMPKKDELLHDAMKRTQSNKVRSGYEREIIKMLPSNLNVSRVYSGVPHTKPHTSSQGQVEIEVNTFEEALELFKRPEFTPEPIARVTMVREQDGFAPTVTFYPECLVKPHWKETSEVDLMYPLLFQMIPLPGEQGRKGVAKVYLEWFTRVTPNIIASIRVYVANHKCRYNRHFSPRPEECRVMAVGYPAGWERMQKPFPNAAPFVTVSWDVNEFDEKNTLVDRFREVAHA
jgi:hypothetical protein